MENSNNNKITFEPLSLVQRDIYFQQQSIDQSEYFNIGGIIKINGKLDIPNLQKALYKLIEQNDCLRSSIFTKNNEPWFKIHDSKDIHCLYKYIDLSNHKESELEAKIFINKNFSLPFNFNEGGHLCEFHLIKIKENIYYFVEKYHHIIIDGKGITIFGQKIADYYNSIIKDEVSSDLQINYYSKFAKEDIEYLNSQLYITDDLYWQNKMNRHFDSVFTRTKYQNNSDEYSTDRKMVSISLLEFENLNQLAHNLGATTTHLFLGILYTYFAGFVNYNTFYIGIPVLNRSNRNAKNTIGLFTNMLPLSLDIVPELKFKELIDQIKKEVRSSYRHQKFPISKIVKYAQQQTSKNLFKSEYNLYDISLSFENYETIHFEHTESCETIELTNHLSKTPLSVVVRKYSHENDVKLIFDYNLNYFKDNEISIHIERLSFLVKNIQHIINQSLGEIYNLHLSENKHLKYDSNSSKTLLNKRYDYDSFNEIFPKKSNTVKYLTLAEHFEFIVKKYPYNTALIYQEKTISYHKLNQLANQLAHYLTSKFKIPENNFIGIMMEKTDLLIVAILGILKAKHAYVPLNVNDPISRRADIISNAKLKIIISQSELIAANHYDNCDLSIINIDELLGTSVEYTENPGLYGEGEDLAYIMYTSGSTGKPKGVMIKHQGIIRLVKDTNYIEIKPEDRILALSSYTFDGSTFDIFSALLNGACIVIPTQQGHLDFLSLSRDIEEKKISVFFITTSLFNVLVDHYLPCVKHVRKILTGGEKMSVKHANNFIKAYGPNRLINVYGPTENTTFSTYYPIDEPIEPGESVPIGHPISNTEVYILTPDNTIQTIGLKGEIGLSGTGLAKGYRQDELLTNKKFIPHPCKEGQLLYKTGDIGLMLANGLIKFTDRADDQIKLRGYRIELGEIELAIKKHQHIEQAVVLFKEDANGNPLMIVYYTANKDLEVSDIIQHLESILPEYMIPKHYIQLDQFDLNTNGKIDKSNLFNIKDLDVITKPGNAEPPIGILEKQLAKLFEENLSKTTMDVTTNYFALGGDSIKAIRLISTINDQLNTTLEIKDLFNNQTIRELALYLNNDSSKDTEKIKLQQIARLNIESLKNAIEVNPVYQSKLPKTYEDIYPMGAIQQGMLFHSLTQINSGIYHDQLFHELVDYNFNYDLFKHSYRLMIEKHSIFRSSLHLEGFPEPIQIVQNGENVEIEIRFVDLSDKEEKQQQLYIQNYLQEDRKKGFFPEKPGGLWRTALFKLSEECYSILRIFHHAILDGWSDASFMTELINVYFELKKNINYYPPALKCTYKDYIIDQEAIKLDPGPKMFWKEKLRTYERTEIPFRLNHNFNINETHQEKQNHSIIIHQSLVEKMKLIQLQEGVSINQIIMACVSYLLKLTTNQNDITFGVVTSCRPEIKDSDRMIGCFLNTVPYRIKLEKQITGSALIQNIKTYQQELQSNYKLPLSEIKKEIDEVSGNLNPITDILYGFLDFHIYKETAKDSLTVHSIVKEFFSTNTLLDIMAIQENEKLSLNLMASERHVDLASLKRLGEYFIKILDYILSDFNLPIDPFKILSEQEQYNLLAFSNYQSDKLISDHSSITEFFWKTAITYPNNIALQHENITLTYKELNDRSNQLARFLLDQYKIKPEMFIGLMMERSIEAIVGILAILKSGGSYVPIDPKYPKTRIEYILKDTSISLLITNSLQTEHQNLSNIQVLNIKDSGPEIAKKNTDDIPEVKRTKHSLAYLIYTSGSTGNPKGVLIEDKGVINLATYMLHKLQMNASSKTLQFASYSFDASICEIFCAILNGGTLVISDSVNLLPVDNLVNTLITQKVTHITLPPSLMPLLPNHKLPMLKCIIAAGEASSPHVLREWSVGRLLFNGYGPTEGTVAATMALIDPENLEHIGRPIDNSTLFIMDKNQSIAPIGVAGEILIGGIGLARGYWNHPELTREKFIDNPIIKGEKLYRTGDIGKWLPNGNLQFLGRNDNQIKIRSHRIEIGEIEYHLSNYSSVSQAAVICKTMKNEDKVIVAYVSGTSSIEENKIKSYLRTVLPEYMIPSRIYEMESLPLTINKKIDKQQLELKEIDFQVNDLGQMNETEKKIAIIWQNNIHLNSIEVTDNFFDLGGHSLSLVKVHHELTKELETTLTLVNLYEYPTIKSLAQYINRDMHNGTEKQQQLTSNRRKKVLDIRNKNASRDSNL